MKKKNKKILIGIIIFIGMIAVYIIFYPKKQNIEYSSEKVVTGSIVQTVSETGTVKSDSEINLSFMSAGRIEKVNVSVGDFVEEGAVLAELDYSALNIRRNEALANLELARTDYHKLLAGATNETIAVSSANVKRAEAAYEAAKKELEQTKAIVSESIAQAEKALFDLESDLATNITATEQAVIVAKTSLLNSKITYQKSIDNSIDSALNIVEDKLVSANNALDAIYSIISIDYAENLLGKKEPNSLENTRNLYDLAADHLKKAKNESDSVKINPTESTVSDLLVNSAKALDETFDALEACYEMLENTISSSNLSQATIDSYKTIISTNQTSIGYTAITAVRGARQNFDTAVLTYETVVSSANETLAQAEATYSDALNAARNNLINTKNNGEQQILSRMSMVDNTLETWVVAQAENTKVNAPANQHDIAFSQARIKQAEAAAESVEKQIEDSLIKAPIAGTITKINYDPGEQAGAGPVFSILGVNNFEIEVLISEADIAKIKKDDIVEITFDSFGEEAKFGGAVYFIEPAQTEIQDVVYYKVKIDFDPKGLDIKPGMTANVTITTATKDNVLLIPSRAIIDRNGDGKFVRIMKDGKAEEIKIETGLRGDGGLVEVLSGLSYNQEIITYIKENK